MSSVTQGSALVDVRDVSVKFDTKAGSVDALESINLRVEEGEFVTVLGPSGCGKSTLLAVIAGLSPPSAGTVFVRGVEARGVQSECGMVFQQDLLLAWRTALENVLLQYELRGERARLHQERALELLRSVGLAGFEHRYPRELSGGMRQRVAICRALVREPPLLLMDEPFGALDAMSREKLNFGLASTAAAEHTTVILVTHSAEEALFLGDRVAIMSPRPGRIAHEVKVDIPRPRREWPTEGVAFAGYLQEVRDVLQEWEVIGGGGDI